MPTLVLVRHGQSQWNLENRFTGWVDVPLTDNGRAEAREAGRLIAGLGVRFDLCFTSVLSRAIETLSIMLKELKQEGLPVVKDQALNERHYGDLQGLNKDETRKKFGDEQVKLWRRSYDVAPPNGESLKDTAARTLPYFDSRILPEMKAGKNVLVSAHGNSLRSIVMELDHLTPEQVVALELPTGVPLRYEFNADGTVRSKQVLT
ncbi:MAG: 2,3-bisphosphoglycerate-dependent phosphoglycerate mutase [Candidatus Omnitrophica bacterium]|nr:2,3-bisphosphoglycerate-dependent phosphoglycerate mutase [Candidatus Omnitrophota bacterium]